jgi:Putative MetA-pathway of phenol degradation
MSSRCVAIVVAFVGGFVFPSIAATNERPLSTDRPDRTESPYTVPRGWFQLESDLVSWGRIDGDNESLTGMSLVTLNMKYGLTDRIDLQFVFLPWVRVEEEVAGSVISRTTDTGPVGLRAKFNIVGNDKPGPAFALLPFAFVPTHGDAVFDFVTWGIVAPLSIPVGSDAAFSAMAGFTRIDNDDSWVTVSMSFGSAIAGDFAGFLELYVSRNSFDTDAIDDTTIDAGITYAPGENWQLDVGVYRGLASETEDWRVFAGASVRLPI